jgi:hypothetical protein
VNRESVVVALLAVLALAAAAGSFAASDTPSLTGSDTLQGSADSDSTAGDDGGPDGPSFGAWVSLPALGVPPGGSSSILGVAFVLAVLVCGGPAVALTGDDDRAPPPDSQAETAETDGDGASSHRGTVRLAYERPGDSAVVRAWSRLADEAGIEETQTPGEAARHAADEGLPGDAVRTIAEQFRAVRYGRADADERRERSAAAALEELDREGDQ